MDHLNGYLWAIAELEKQISRLINLSRCDICPVHEKLKDI